MPTEAGEPYCPERHVFFSSYHQAIFPGFISHSKFHSQLSTGSKLLIFYTPSSHGHLPLRPLGFIVNINHHQMLLNGETRTGSAKATLLGHRLDRGPARNRSDLASLSELHTWHSRAHHDFISAEDLVSTSVVTSHLEALPPVPKLRQSTITRAVPLSCWLLPDQLELDVKQSKSNQRDGLIG